MSRADLLAAPAMDAVFVSHVRFVDPKMRNSFAACAPIRR